MKINNFFHQRVLPHIFALSCMIHIYGKESCIYCKMAELSLKTCKTKIKFHDINKPKEFKKALFALSEVGIDEIKKVPQIFICDTYIGGYSDMMKMKRNDELRGVFEENNLEYKCSQRS